MKRLIIPITAIIALTLAGACALHCWLSNPRLGYVETPVLMSQFTEAARARVEFETARKEWDGNLKRLNDSLEATVNRIKADYPRAGAKDQAAMRQDLQRWNDALNRYKEAVKVLAVKKEAELTQPVVTKINEFLQLWGKEHGYDIVFGTLDGGNILYADRARDLTAEILKDLNAHYRNLPVKEQPAKAPKPAKPAK